MKSCFARLAGTALSILFITSAAFAQEAPYTIDPAHSSVNFEVRHLFSKAKGRFNDFEGTFNFDEKKLIGSSIDFKIKATSVDTANAKRDDHLRNEDFFHVAKFPEITFKSTKITAAGKKKYKIVGDLTLLGQTKPVTFNGEFLGKAKDLMGNETASFTATTTIKRKEFGMVWNKAADHGGLVLGEDVNVEVQIEAQKKKETSPATTQPAAKDASAAQPAAAPAPEKK